MAGGAPTTEGPEQEDRLDDDRRNLVAAATSGIDSLERTIQAHSMQGIAVLSAGFVLAMGALALKEKALSWGAFGIFFLVATGTCWIFLGYDEDYRGRLATLRETLRSLLQGDRAYAMIAATPNDAANALRPILNAPTFARRTSFIGVAIALVIMALVANAFMTVLDDCRPRATSGAPTGPAIKFEITHVIKSSPTNQVTLTTNASPHIQAIVACAAAAQNTANSGQILSDLVDFLVKSAVLTDAAGGDLKKQLLRQVVGGVLEIAVDFLKNDVASDKAPASPPSASTSTGWIGDLVVNCGSTRTSSQQQQRVTHRPPAPSVIMNQQCGQEKQNTKESVLPAGMHELSSPPQ